MTEYSSLRRKPEPRCRLLVEGQMTLDSGLRRNDVRGVMLCPDIFEHRLYRFSMVTGSTGSASSNPKTRLKK